jgi:hypothetical protein
MSTFKFFMIDAGVYLMYHQNMKPNPKPKIKNNNIRMSEDLAEAMREAAKGRRVYIGVVWEEAARAYLAAELRAS